MKQPHMNPIRPNPLSRLLNERFLLAFIVFGIAAFVAGFVHSGIAIVAFPLLAWSPFVLIIGLHLAFGARALLDILIAAAWIAIAFALAVMAVRWLYVPHP